MADSDRLQPVSVQVFSDSEDFNSKKNMSMKRSTISGRVKSNLSVNEGIFIDNVSAA